MQASSQHYFEDRVTSSIVAASKMLGHRQSQIEEDFSRLVRFQKDTASGDIEQFFRRVVYRKAFGAEYDVIVPGVPCS